MVQEWEETPKLEGSSDSSSMESRALSDEATETAVGIPAGLWEG